MKIALINENSQAAKNAIVEKALRKVVEPMGFTVDNYGMYAADDAAQLTYVQNGILAAVLLNSGAADYVITGCGTGEGAMLALNSFPGVICGHVADPLDAYTFAQINDGNAISLPFAKGFGWGGDLNLEYIFEKLFCEPSGQGYPRERAVPEQRNKKILDGVRAVAFRDLCDILRELDRDLVKGAFAGVTEGRVPKVVAKGNRLCKIFIKAQGNGHGAGNLRHLKRVGKAGAVMVALRT